MRSYGQFCPVAQALEIVGERWTLLIIRELLCGNYRFGELLHGVPLIPRSLLSQRLKWLEESGLVERHERSEGAGFEYRLTEPGRQLESVVMGLGVWGKQWAKQKLTAEQLDPVLLMWDMRRQLDVERLPVDRTVVMFWFRDLPAKRSRYWLCVERPEVELCLTNPGFDVALTIETKLRTMVEVWMGERNLKHALAEKAIELDGPAALTRAFPSWLLLSSFAHIGVGREA
jgi:DNA-binding HxlR family transcriptional regulator